MAPSSADGPPTVVRRQQLSGVRLPNELLREMVHCVPMGWFVGAQANWQLGIVLGTYLGQAGAKFATVAKRMQAGSQEQELQELRWRLRVAELKELTVREELKEVTVRDLARMKDLGVAMSCHTHHIAGQRHVTLSANYIAEDWRMTRRTLRVENCATLELDVLVHEVLEEFQLDGAKVILLTVDSLLTMALEPEEVQYQMPVLPMAVDPEMQYKMPNNVKLLLDANYALDMILAQSLGEQFNLAALVLLCFRLFGVLRDLDRVDQFPQAVVLSRSVNTGQEASLQFASKAYLAVKLVNEHANGLAALLAEQEGMEELVHFLQQIDWQVCTELEQFLKYFHKTAKMFADSTQPNFHKIVPNVFALMRECQQPQSLDGGETPMDEINSLGSQDAQASGSTSSSDMPSFFRSLRDATSRRLREWIKDYARPEHWMATVLDPHLRQLPNISDHQRTMTYNRIRDLVGLSEPEEDELDRYLLSQFTAEQTRDILEFWSSVGQSQFPRLAQLARFVLAPSAPIPIQPPSSHGTLLNLSPEVLNSLNQQSHRHGQQQQLLFRQHPPSSSSVG